MPQTRNAWILWTTVVCVVVMAAGWFFGVSPRLDERDLVVSETDDLRGSNDMLDIEVASLRTAFATLDERKAEIAALQVSLPTDLQLSRLVAEITEVEQRTGVVVTELTPAAAAAVGARTAPAPQAEPETTDETGDTTDTPAPQPEPAGSDALVAIPVTLVVYGSHAETFAFLSELQNATSRYVLVSSVQIDGLVAAEATETTPATEDGDLGTVITAYAFAYADAATQRERAAAVEPTEGE